MFPELEGLEIPIILYILYVPYILKGTEHVGVGKNIKIVMENRRTIMEQQIKELTLLLAYLTSWDDKDRLTKQENKKSWKGYDFGILNKLYEEEYIYQENKDKYFIWEEKGIVEEERLIEKYNINKE